MKYINCLFTYFISLQLLLMPSVSISSETPRFETNMILKLFQQEIDVNESYYFPEKYIAQEHQMAGEDILNTNDLIIEKLKDSSFNLDAIKSNLMLQMSELEEIQILNFSYILKKMGSSDLEKIFKQALKKGLYPASLKANFELAFSIKEKKQVVLEMIKHDLSQVKSTAVKKIGLATRESLIKELETTNSLFTIKRGEKWKNILLIALSVAIAGFATWGLMSSIKNAYAKKTKKMHEDMDQAETDLEAEYAQSSEDLIALYEERARLREEGYVWTVCSTTNQVQTASCSFDHATHSGTEVCITRCLKNPQTGDATMHSTSCSSAYIPNNCFLRNQYDIGNDDGFDAGYDDGYYYAYQRAYDDAYYSYYDSAYDSAFNNGYDNGYNSGYTDGLAEAAYDDTYGDETDPDSGIPFKLLKSDNVKTGYKKGYREGYLYAGNLLVN